MDNSIGIAYMVYFRACSKTTKYVLSQNMPPICDGWFLTLSKINHSIEIFIFFRLEDYKIMKKVHKWHKVEVIVDKLIPYALILLLFSIIGELFFSEKFGYFPLFVSIIDGFVISVLAVDLFFKYTYIKNVPKFLRRYWLEVIALFPAFLIVRVLEEIITITKLEDTIRFSQEALEFSEKIGIGPTRVSYFLGLIRPLARLPRFLAAFHFYEKPTHRHLNKNISKELQQINKTKNKRN